MQGNPVGTPTNTTVTHSNGGKLLAWVILVITLCFAATAKPILYGDGAEYFLQLISLAEGHGPSLSEGDLVQLQNLQSKNGQIINLDLNHENNLRQILSSK